MIIIPINERSAVVSGEFVTYSHVKTRKTFSITIEFPEEQALHVLNTLGSPIGGNSKPVAIALLDKTVIKENLTTEQSEGDKLRIRAIMLCKNNLFQAYLGTIIPSKFGIPSESEAAWYIKSNCNIESRSELTTNLKAQKLFLELDQKFKNWQYENQYADNLHR